MKKVVSFSKGLADFFWATGEPKVFRLFRFVAVLVMIGTLSTAMYLTVVANQPFIMLLGMVMFVLEGLMLVLAEIGYEDAHGLRYLVISDDEGLD